MSETRRKFSRPFGNRPYRKLFVIAVEGEKTEPLYFSLFHGSNSIIQVRCLKGGSNSSPLHVLDRMKRHLREVGLRTTDEAWLIVDKDQWTDAQLIQLHEWARKGDNHGFALSNPKFEYWLLLHFEDGIGILSAQDCTARLKEHLPEFDKGFDVRKITRNKIVNAVARAKRRDNPPCADWPRAIGVSTVYRLVEKLVGQNS